MPARQTVARHMRGRGLLPVTADLAPFVVVQPGIYNLSHEEYHADLVPGGSLSSTGARKLTPPDGSPARFKYDLGRPDNRRTFDLGQLAHNQLTGAGPEVVVLDDDNFRKQKTRDDRDDAYANGQIPVLPQDMDVVYDMMRALEAHEWAAALFERGTGLAEPSLFWESDGVWKRSRPDFVSFRRHPTTHQLMIPEYKTAPSAEKHKFTKHAYDLGYHQQAAWICDAAKGTNIVPADEDPMLLFVVQEKKAPYIVNVIEATPDALMWGRLLNAEAVDLYKRCRKSGRWPGYSDGIERMAPTPAYLAKAYEDYLDD